MVCAYGRPLAAREPGAAAVVGGSGRFLRKVPYITVYFNPTMLDITTTPLTELRTQSAKHPLVCG
jgi:hypothetical protein